MNSDYSSAAPFIATRKHHLSELTEDYVEIISDLIATKGEVKVCDLAKYFAVSHVTVIRSISRLKKNGFLQSSSSQAILLTEEGKSLAAFCKMRHQFLMKYLIALGIPTEVAAIDVEGMEHHISVTTMNAMEQHLESL